MSEPGSSLPPRPPSPVRPSSYLRPQKPRPPLEPVDIVDRQQAEGLVRVSFYLEPVYHWTLIEMSDRSALFENS